MIMQEKVYNKRLVYRVLRTFITIIIVIVAALGYLFLTTLKHIYQSELEKRGDALCNNLAFNSRYEMFIRDDEAMKSLLDGILLEEDIIFAYTIDDDQNILAFKSKGINEKDKKLIDNIIAKGNRINRTGKEYHSLKSDLNVLHIAKPVLLEPEESKSPDETVLYITTDQTLVSVDKTLLLGYVHVGMSLERLNQRISESERFILVLSIIFIVFFSFIAMLFSRTIVNPIIALVQATRNVSQGDLNYRAEVKSKDEIGLLTDSFNTMTEDLQRFQNEILVLNRNLEEKIKERTRELDQTNQELIRRNEDLQRMARELEQSNVKIREADRLKSEFLANMSHELRTPLNSIIGFSALSLKDPEIVGMPSIKDNFEEIHKNGKQLLDIINDILDLSKVEAGRMEFVNKKFEISIVIEDVIKTMKVIKEKKPVEFQSHIEENLPLVLGDPDRIRQVLLNVGSNAVKFTDKGSIEISANRKGNYIQISVKDTGVGIKEVDIPKVFESFRQIDGSSTRKEGGTGLGMTISKKFVELMGGTIWIESEFGRGTTVHFTIPIGPEVKHYLQEETPEKTVHVPATSIVARPVQKKNFIFIVEDDMSAIKLYEKILAKHGYEVGWETSGKNACQRAIELKPFAIFLDINLPDKSGWEILTELKMSSECRDIPIVMSSILAEQHKGFALGAVEYLVKPIHEEDVIRVLNHIKINGKKVVVVDDNYSDVNLVTKILEKWNYEIFSAYDGKNGVDLINQVMPHVVFLDLMMPIMDGFQVVEYLKRRKSTRMIPIIVMTAKDLTNQEKDFLKGKIDALIKKSQLTEESLVEVLFDVLRHYDFGEDASEEEKM